MEMVKVQNGTCMFCGQIAEVLMPRESYERWFAGTPVQVAWPEGTAADREILISGTHGPCWNKHVLGDG